MAKYVSSDNLEYYNQKINQVIIDGDSINDSITVQLGDNGKIGSYSTGDTIQSNTPIKTIIKKILQKQVPPTYTAPTISISNNSGMSPGSYEIGTTISPKLKATYTKNDGGNLISITINPNVANGTISPLTGEVTPFILENQVQYSATVTYEDGPIKNDNLGEPYPTGKILAGTKNSSNMIFSPYRVGYFWGVLNTSSAEAPLTSAIIRSGTKKNGAYTSGNIPNTIQASTVANRKRIFVACPKTNIGVKKVIMPSAMNADCTADFVKQANTVIVEGANGYQGIEYNVWVYEPAMISDDQTFIVTLG